MFPLMLDHLLSACKVYEIPILLTVPANLQEKAKKILGDVGSFVHLVAPEELEAQIRKYL